MIRSSAEENRPLLKRAKARDRFSRVQDRHGEPANCIAELTRQGRDAGQVLEKVQGHSFGLQDGPPIAFDLEETVSILCRVPVLTLDGQDKGCVDRSKGLHCSGETSDYQRLLSDDACQRWCRRGKECGCRNVAMREVFLEGESNDAPYVG